MPEDCEIPPLPEIPESGRKVALPYLFFFKNSISSFAVSSVSVTIFWMLPPSAVSIAISYVFSDLDQIRYDTDECPAPGSFCSMTRRMLLP